jgi:ATP phosphoribosyltransferase
MYLILHGGVFTARSERKTYIITSNASIEPDIRMGLADFALIGSDKYGEIADSNELSFEPVGKLACRFALARRVDEVRAVDNSLRIATSYPRALQKFAAEQALENYAVMVRPGKVEGTIAQRLADARWFLES